MIWFLGTTLWFNYTQFEDNPDEFRLETAAPWLINFVSQEFEKPEKDGQFCLIRNHKKFSWAQEWITERIPELSDQIEIAAIPTICCIAENTWDIEEIFKVWIHLVVEFSGHEWKSTKLFQRSRLPIIMPSVALHLS